MTNGTSEDPCKAVSTYLATVVKQALEPFRENNLPENQYKELMTIIRNALYTAEHARTSDCKASEGFVNHHLRLIPKEWDDPEFLRSYQVMLDDETLS